MSLPGTDPVIVECLPGSPLVNEVTEAGYELTPVGEGERIIPGQIVQRFAAGPSGAFEPLTADSIRPIALTTRHAGIVRVERFRFSAA
ncbi:hypothetical protein [Bradyrhizobium oligotrophicum]|uniref:hypothetical protein n=1 Tax=Bradyrhizobium oligotrophicum TaxID=44255 RepID=UPI003EB82F31